MPTVTEAGLSREDYSALLPKLERFAEALSPGERVAFDTFIQQALTGAGEQAEVSGYDFSTALPSGDLLHAFGIA